jgi:hypothetical protein
MSLAKLGVSGIAGPGRLRTVIRGMLVVLAWTVCATMARGQQSGVLIGVVEARAEEAQEFESIHAPKYRTLWVATDANGKLGLLATIEELVVPRRDGFWHVGVKQVCEFNEDEDGGNERLSQRIWAAPVGKAGQVEVQQPCRRHKPADYAPPYGRAAGEKKISQCGYLLTDIEFVSPELISEREYEGQSEDCEARGGRYSVFHHVQRYDSNEPVGFGQLLGPQAGAAYVKAMPEKAKDDNDQECGEPFSGKDMEWRVGRSAGRWAAYMSQNVGYFGCSVDALIRFRIPNALTGESFVLSDWTAFYKIEKDLQDGHISPAGDLAVIVTKTEMKFYEVREKAPGKLLLTLPGSAIVMVQWATGGHVEDWTGQMKKIASEKLPGVVLKVKAVAK